MIANVVIGLLAAFVLWFVYIIVMLVMATNSCLAYGYPTAKVDAWGTRYCVKRVDQTDVVVPLKNLRK